MSMNTNNKVLDTVARSPLHAGMVSPGDVLAAQASASSVQLVLYTAIMNFHGMTVGGSLSYAGLVLPHHVNNSSQLLHLTTDQGTWFVSVSPLAMGLGVLLSIPVSEALGRKKMFLIANFLSLLGYICLYLAPSFLTLVLARTLQCTGMGLGAMIIGVYLNEISTINMRGPLSGANMTANVIGALFYTGLCILLPIQFLSLVFAGHNLLANLMILLIPDSPQWLVRHDREDEARASLKKVRGSGYPGLEVEMDEIKKVTKARESLAQASFCQALSTRTFTIPMATFAVVFFFVACAGNDAIMYYGPTIFAKMDLPNVSPGVLNMVPWIGFSIGYSSSIPLMARMNRVTQFVTFASIMSVSMFCLGATVLLRSQGQGDPVLLEVGLVTALLLATTAYGMGVGAIPYTMVGEVFTPEHRTLGSCMAQIVRSVAVFALVKVIPYLFSAFGQYSLFLFHGVVCALAAIFVKMFVPETRGKTLTQLCAMYTRAPENVVVVKA